MKIDTTRNEVNRALAAENMCSHLQRKLFSQDGEYRAIREQIETDPTLTAVRGSCISIATVKRY